MHMAIHKCYSAKGDANVGDSDDGGADGDSDADGYGGGGGVFL